MIHTPKFPLHIGDRAQFEKTETVKRVVMFHLRNLLLTSPGERISDPLYGVGIKLFLFENITVGLLNNIAKEIELSINKYLNYINIENVSVTSPQDSNSLEVQIAFSVPDLDIAEVFKLEVDSI